jgi:hypothetical protein
MTEVAERPAAKRKLSTGDANTTNSEANVSQHGFSGETCEIKLFKAEAGESAQQFVGLNNYTAILHREKWVRIPVEVAGHLESLTYSVLEADPMDPDNRAKDTWQEKQRFPLQRRS